MPQTPIIERAYALAQSGECDNVDDVKRRLSQEGYESVAAWFQSRTFKTALQTLCVEARKAPDGPAAGGA